MRLRVLFVDDEPRLLEGLQRSFRSLRGDWETSFADCGENALAILAASPFDVLVTDMRMPGMDGVALLKIVVEKHPDLLRIVLSGQSDMESLVKAAGVAHQCLSKPCPLNTLKEKIVSAFAVVEKLHNPELRSLISAIDALPSVAPSFNELVQAIDSPSVALSKVAKVVSRDIAMSSKVLQLMNSAFFDKSRPVSDPGEAVSYLGTGPVKALLTAVQAFRSLDDRAGASFDPQELWNHSIACSELADRIAKDMFPGERETHNLARVAGLLHDIGKLVVGCKMPRQSEEVALLARARKISVWDAEREVLGVSHAEIGAHLLALWGLPSRIVEAVAYHHCPSGCSNEDFTVLGLVHIANGLLRRRETKEGYAAPLDEAYLRRTGYTQLFAAEREPWANRMDPPV